IWWCITVRERRQLPQPFPIFVVFVHHGSYRTGHSAEYRRAGLLPARNHFAYVREQHELFLFHMHYHTSPQVAKDFLYLSQLGMIVSMYCDHSDQIVADVLDGVIGIAVMHLFNMSCQPIKRHGIKILQRFILASGWQRFKFGTHLLYGDVSVRTGFFGRLLTPAAKVQTMAVKYLRRAGIPRCNGAYFFGFHNICVAEIGLN